MSIDHRNPYNQKLKSILRERSITYDMIAEKAGYSYWTISDWMRHPLTQQREKILADAINKVIRDRGGDCYEKQ